VTRASVLLFLLVVICPCSRASDPQLGNFVSRFLNDPAYIEGFDIKHLRQSGDAVCVAVLKILDPSTPLSEKTVAAAIDLIDYAFGDTSFIQDPGDRNPGVSLFFLRSVSRGQYTPHLKKRIADTTKLLMVVRSEVLQSRQEGKE
jgi:hypothetical protein